MTSKDPVCGMVVIEETVRYSFKHEGVTYYFCSQYCLDQFARNPSRYVKGK
ncbi:MAG: YHS domain-containing protein [Aigarchaeota archaeon]|nr:YHS domain-containing protein [Aigarchaeota archaeon]MDW8093113.1 YHS domain-containing protein [Nitrososphaerota archaeon]